MIYPTRIAIKNEPLSVISEKKYKDFGNFKFEKTNYNFVSVISNYGLCFDTTKIFIVDLEKDEEIHSALYSDIPLYAGNRSDSFIIPYVTGESIASAEGFRVFILFRDGSAIASTDITLQEWVQSNWWEHRDSIKPMFVKTQGEVIDATRQVYDPTLPEHCYLNTNTEDLREFGGNVFQAYQGKRIIRGGVGGAAIERSDKLCLLGSYSGGYDCKSAVWATSDGGHNLFNKLDFVTMSFDAADFINTSMITENYTGGLSLNIRETTLPTFLAKEVYQPYSYTTKGIEAINKGTQTSLTVTAHGITEPKIVAISGSSPGFEFMINSGFSSTIAGSKLYWVNPIDADTLYIYAYNGSYENSIPARHIHKINEYKEGFLIGTGEEYPHGWVYALEQMYKDGSYRADAWKTFRVQRLTSGEDSVQRTCGILADGLQDPTLLVAIDHSEVANRLIQIEGRPTLHLWRSAFGVYKIKMSDIDDFTKAECVCPMPEPVINMKQTGNLIVACGNLGGFGVSTDGGKTWGYYKRYEPLLRMIGNDGRSLYFYNNIKISPK